MLASGKYEDYERDSMIKPKKGQGLGFISVIVMVALFYFIFKYQTQTFDFVMTTGDQQAHLVTSFVETEKAKMFAETAVRQAAYEDLWQHGIKDCSFGNICSDATFSENLSFLYDNYISTYTTSTILLETEFPAYKLEPSCTNDKITINAYGFAEGCHLKTGFPFPLIPCEDVVNKSICDSVKLTGNGGQACKWNSASVCEETTPAPYCEKITDSAACTGDCVWQISYSEAIHSLSAPLVNYQFSIDTDAHFIEDIDCTGYSAFMKSRKLAVKPACELDVAGNAKINTDVLFSINYRDDTAPNQISLKILNSTNDEVASADLSTLKSDAADTNYFDGKLFTFDKSFNSAGNYNATVECKDADGNTANAKKNITITS